MKILIDYTQIPLQRVGVGYYAFNLLRNIDYNNPKIKYLILLQNDDYETERLLSDKNAEIIKVNASRYRNFLSRIFFEQIIIPQICKKRKIDVLHSLHYSFPLALKKTKIIVTIHDLTFFLTPQYHILIKNLYFRFFIKMAAKKAKKIICVSQSTKNDFLKLTNANPLKCERIYLGIESTYSDFQPDFTFEEELKLKYNIVGKYILFIGTIEPRKNIVTLLAAFNSIKTKYPEIKLVIAGKKGWNSKNIYQYITENSLEGEIIFTNYITEKEKLHLLKSASIFVYPSNYEGFGIPVLEALSIGTPTITSNISSLPEVAGNGAVLVTPTSVTEIEDGISRILEDKEYREKLILNGKLHSQRFSWEKMALETINVYEQQR